MPTGIAAEANTNAVASRLRLATRWENNSPDMIMAAAVTTIVVGAGMSTAICGSIRGSQTLEMNSQTAIMAPNSARFGKYAPTRMIHTSTGLIGSGAAGSGGTGARAASMRPDTP